MLRLTRFLRSYKYRERERERNVCFSSTALATYRFVVGLGSLAPHRETDFLYIILYTTTTFFLQTLIIENLEKFKKIYYTKFP